MTTVFAVFDGFGGLVGIVNAETKHQLSCALDDLADEFESGASLLEPITDRDWQTLTSGSNFISILCAISDEKELEVKGVPLRDYTHFPSEASHAK